MTALVICTERMRTAEREAEAALVAHQRLLLLVLLFALALLLVFGRLAAFAIEDPAARRGATSAGYVPERGDILDRNGVPLARSIAGYAIWVDPAALLGDPDMLASELARIFPDTSAAKFRAILTGGRPAYLRRRALPAEVRAVHALGEVAIEFPREAERLYPEREMAAHVLGFANMANQGRMGMEKALDARLTDPALRGTPVKLSIDTRVQGALEAELGRAMATTSAIGAAGVVLDVDSGEVLGMASLPSFDPNKVGTDSLAHQRNEVTMSVYELGSTFKPITVAAALDAGTVRNLAVRYDATVPLKVGGFNIRDSHPSGRWLNVPEALVHSSNIVTARIADNLGRARLEKVLRDLAFDQRPHIDLGEKAAPLWPKNWGRVTNMTVSYGHGIAVTPLHLASAYAALVNGGIWRPATLVKVESGKASHGRRVFTAATSARMRQLLRMIVKDGTGSKADVPGYRVGGKTGSAEKPHEGGYRRNSVVSTFAAAFPMDNPRYVVIAMLDEPQGVAETGFQRTAGWTAAPVVARLVPRIGPMLGVYPDEGRDVDVSELMPLLWSPKGSH